MHENESDEKLEHGVSGNVRDVEHVHDLQSVFVIENGDGVDAFHDVENLDDETVDRHDTKGAKAHRLDQLPMVAKGDAWLQRFLNYILPQEPKFLRTAAAPRTKITN